MVRWFGVACWVVCCLVGFGVGVGWGVGWLRGWGRLGCSVSGLVLGVFLKACFLFCDRITMKTTLKSDHHCELYDSVNHLKVERILLSWLFCFKKCFLVMKAAAKCDKRCELHDSVDHRKFEIISLFRVVLEISFLSVIVCVCVGVCVLMVSRWMSWFEQR